MGKLTAKDKVDIIHRYEELTPMAEMAAEYGVSRQYVHRIIKGAGISANDKPIEVSCSCCGNIIIRSRARIRRQKRHFCGYECYYAWIEAGQPGKYIKSRQGQRIARQVVSKFIDLRDGHIVHHINRNTLDNQPTNLMVFRCAGDHIRHHRGFDVEPLWDGSKL